MWSSMHTERGAGSLRHSAVSGSQRSSYLGRIDFAFYPFDPVGKRTIWRQLRVESLEDVTVNKLAGATHSQSAA